MGFTKKSGGGISITTLGILILVCLMSHSFYLKSINTYHIERTIQDNIKLHYLVLESIYYLRNEINDETYYDLHYCFEDVSIDIEINHFKKTGVIEISYGDVVFLKTYQIDFENKSILAAN